MWEEKTRLYTRTGHVHDFDNGLLQLMLLKQIPTYTGKCDRLFENAIEDADQDNFYRCWYQEMGYKEACPSDSRKCKMSLTVNSKPENFMSETIEIIPPFSGFKRRTEIDDIKDNDFLLHTKRHELFLKDEHVHCTAASTPVRDH